MARPKFIIPGRILGLSILLIGALGACNRDNPSSEAETAAAGQESKSKPTLKSDPVIARKVMEGQWRLVAIDQRQLRQGGTPTVVFGDEGNCWGSTGVNDFRTTFTLEGPDQNRVKVGPAAVTRKAGPPEAMALENLFLERFESVSSFKVDGDYLYLDAGTNQNLTFQRIVN